MNTTHTKGPWKAEPMCVYGIDIRADDIWLASVNGDHGHKDGENSGFPSNPECRANARLIAASPDAYAMATEIVDSYEAHTDGFARQVLRSHYEHAKAFLAKVKGES